MKTVENYTDEEKLNNLAKLAEYLESLPDDYKKFDMRMYMQSHSKSFYTYIVDLYYSEKFYKECDTVACAAGHGIAAGILPTARAWQSGCWNIYVKDCFLNEEDNVDKEYELYDYLFDSEWEESDNTAKGAAKRIRKYLKEGDSVFLDRDPENFYVVDY